MDKITSATGQMQVAIGNGVTIYELHGPASGFLSLVGFNELTRKSGSAGEVDSSRLLAVSITDGIECCYDLRNAFLYIMSWIRITSAFESYIFSSQSYCVAN
jgi:hypothetical protein